MRFIPDIVFIALIIVAFAAGHKKGFINSVWKIAALALTVILVAALKEKAVQFFYDIGAAEKLLGVISDTVKIPQGGGVNIVETLHLPAFMQPQIDYGINNAADAANVINNAAAYSLTNIILTIAACVLLFIILRLLLMAVHMIVDSLSKAPVINGTNRLLGGVLAAVNMVFIVFLLLSMATIFVPAGNRLFDIINNSYIVSYLYNNNILLQAFMKF